MRQEWRKRYERDDNSFFPRNRLAIATWIHTIKKYLQKLVSSKMNPNVIIKTNFTQATLLVTNFLFKNLASYFRMMRNLVYPYGNLDQVPFCCCNNENE